MQFGETGPTPAMTILDVCAYLGLAAVGIATVNMLLGLLIALRYSPVRLWPHRRINIFRLHNWTAYLVLLLILLHPAVLLLRSSTHFGWRDVLLPIHSPVQPTLNTVGAAGLYILLVVIFTSLLRLRMARPLWRNYIIWCFRRSFSCSSTACLPILNFRTAKSICWMAAKCSSRSAARFQWLPGDTGSGGAAGASASSRGCRGERARTHMQHLLFSPQCRSISISSVLPRYSYRSSAMGTFPFFQTKSWKSRRLNLSPCATRASASSFMICSLPV